MKKTISLLFLLNSIAPATSYSMYQEADCKTPEYKDLYAIDTNYSPDSFKKVTPNPNDNYYFRYFKESDQTMVVERFSMQDFRLIAYLENSGETTYLKISPDCSRIVTSSCPDGIDNVKVWKKSSKKKWDCQITLILGDHDINLPQEENIIECVAFCPNKIIVFAFKSYCMETKRTNIYVLDQNLESQWKGMFENISKPELLIRMSEAYQETLNQK